MEFKAQKMEDTPYKLLPIELQVTILLKLPVKSLVRFKCVSKIWLTEITSQSFIDLYNHENYPQNHDSNHSYLILVGRRSISSFDYSSGRGIVSNFALPLKCRKKLNHRIVGSCNGLLCFENITSRKIIVYNPITLANWVMPIPVFPEAYTEYYNMGFGYDHKSNDYKILSVFRDKVAYIFRLKSNTCEEIKYTPPPFLSSMVYSNSALHWVGPMTPGSLWSVSSEIISCFDIGSEKFYDLRTPLFPIITWTSWNIADLKGYLHFVLHSFPAFQTAPSLEIWIMKEYGVQNSWTKLLKYSSVEDMYYCRRIYIPSQGFSQPNVYVYSKDDQEILVKYGESFHPKALFSYNLITREFKKVRATGFDGVNLFDRDGLFFAPWSPSFVSLY